MYGTAVLGEAFEPEERFEEPDGTPILLCEDILGNQRSERPVPGPFEFGPEISEEEPRREEEPGRKEEPGREEDLGRKEESGREEEKYSNEKRQYPVCAGGCFRAIITVIQHYHRFQSPASDGLSNRKSSRCINYSWPIVNTLTERNRLCSLFYRRKRMISGRSSKR